MRVLIVVHALHVGHGGIAGGVRHLAGIVPMKRRGGGDLTPLLRCRWVRSVWRAVFRHWWSVGCAGGKRIRTVRC
eukprot:8582661-Heterocapsa_arctica.AAC.1